MSKIPLTVFIPVYNEENNIARAILSISGYVNQIILIDSNSTDATIAIAKQCSEDVDVINIPFTTFSNKMNTALNSSIIKNEWVMRLDADEVIVNPELFFNQLSKCLIDQKNYIGFYIIRRYYFLNNFVRHGGMYPRNVIRIWKKGRAIFEDRLLDERMVVAGDTLLLQIEIADIDQRGLLHWFKKHINYARLEAIQATNPNETIRGNISPHDMDSYQNKLKYYKMPMFVRPFLYLGHRLFIQKGYKDNIIGVFYHFVHGLIYRLIVDVFILKFRFK